MRAALVASLVAVCLVGMVACGAGQSIAVTPHSAPTDTGATTAQAEASFTVDISGAYLLQMPPGDIDYHDSLDMTVAGVELPTHRVLVMSADGDERRFVLTLRFSGDLEPGNHRIMGGAFDPMQAPVAAEVVEFSVGGNASDADALHFDNNLDGSLTLDEAGTIISGSFNFSAEALQRLDGEETVLSILAAGTFTDIPLAQAGSDATAEPDAPSAAASGD